MNDLLMTGMDLMTVAQDGPRQTGPDFGKASPFGLIIVVLLLIAVFLLVWSMNRHLRKLPKSFGAAETEGDEPAGERKAGEVKTGDGESGGDPDLATENPADGTERGSS
ncbi:hypothetical protein C6A87_021605 [Mycobacterium sp. ITM-2016-00317]|jgi:hypothetical protein|uniref:hypothetical protein n=1 Tax=Mycobacterium sp. ITM-2016-00317 TaxID=2099694 RepID=UPI00287FB6AB|nr:hypothetical protein [Mycobacterium sp. ITM-2016-00317]WNG86418.1 hypothetical protein C6A87_021605 [Mycobacterium sp. ITM-2016-00317]